MSTGERKLIAMGTCKCLLEPAGRYGLEGYNAGDSYAYHEMQSDEKYFRVFPDPHSSYYETCSARTFAKYFSVKERGRI